MGCGATTARSEPQLTGVVPAHGTRNENGREGKRREGGAGRRSHSARRPEARRKKKRTQETVNGAAADRKNTRKTGDGKPAGSGGKQKKKAEHEAPGAWRPLVENTVESPNPKVLDSVTGLDVEHGLAAGGLEYCPAQKVYRIEMWLHLITDFDDLMDPQSCAGQRKRNLDSSKRHLQRGRRGGQVEDDASDPVANLLTEAEKTSTSENTRPDSVFNDLELDEEEMKRLSVPNLQRWVAALGLNKGSFEDSPSADKSTNQASNPSNVVHTGRRSDSSTTGTSSKVTVGL